MARVAGLARDAGETAESGIAVIRLRVWMILAALPLLASCFVFHCGPYACPQAVEGRELYAPLLAAIERYRKQHSVYPESLVDLSPEFIESIPALTNEAGPTLPEYRRVDDRFELMFQYFGPGMNWCTYSPDIAWRCDGHY